MQLPRPVLPSQRYSPACDYAYDTHHELVPSTRTPLGESTGNVQPHSLATSAFCYTSPLSLSPPIHTIPTPPILPTQALTSSYGTSLRVGRSLHRNVSLQESPMGYSRGSKNPIYAYKHFADYRNKVMQKELEKENPTWPLWLEDAFLDALLLIPQMGRKKFSSKTVLYGRNMLITEYLWIYHWLLHPPQNGERIPDRKQREKGPDGKTHPMFRTRKQVSSHIQVLKGFFSTLVTFHFIFPSKKHNKDDDKKLLKEEEESDSFKNNRVLISLADSRLPDERPNYEYFARLLNADNDVFLRPKQCWIFVSSTNVSLKEKHITTEEGATKKQVLGYTPDDHWLSEADYPHLKLNDGKDYKDLPRTGNRPTVLLHEYTKQLTQKESSSIKDISNKWEVRFPELKEKLVKALSDTRSSDERSSRCVVGPCDTFHFKVVLDLHATSKFPDGSELNGLVELSISQPNLHNHSWRSVTSVVKPDELHISDEEPDFWERSNPVDVSPQHRPGCNSVGRCDCTGRGNRDFISVPFPAHSWASTFIKLAPYVTAERERKDRERAAREAGSLRGGRAEHEAARLKKEKDEASASSSSSSHKSKMPSPVDLLAQVAMYQEIWSAPMTNEANTIKTDNNNGTTTKQQQQQRSGANWTRRAVILWTFVPVHDHTDDKGKTVTVPAAANWRFLTKFDPTSQYHQRHAYFSGSPPVVARDNVMSPNPGYAHHVNAAMHENFGAAAYGDAAATSAAPGLNGLTLPSHGQHHHHHHPHHLGGGGGMNNLMDSSFPTPPPSGNLHGSYAHSFDNGGNNNVSVNGGSQTIGSADSLHHHLSFMSDGTTSGTGTDTTSTTTAAAEDPFLGGLVADYMLADVQRGHYMIDSNGNVSSHGRSRNQHQQVSWVDNSTGTGLTSTTEPSQQWAAVAAAALGQGVGQGRHGGQDLRDNISGSWGVAEEAHTPQSHLSSQQHHSQLQHQQHDAGELMAPEHQDAWTAWQAAELARLDGNGGVGGGVGVGYDSQSHHSWDDEDSFGADAGTVGEFELGGTGLTPLRNHALSQQMHSQSQSQSQPQLLSQSQDQSQSQSQSFSQPQFQGLSHVRSETSSHTSPTLLAPNRKRSRDESADVDGDDGSDDGSVYAAAHSNTMRRKLSHPNPNPNPGFGQHQHQSHLQLHDLSGHGHGHGLHAAPTAVMDDGLQGQSYLG
ncbi:Uu.00g028470.m01.CDS01 [Anthostomella pinea]|uniref:Uu.00g028470.m01.CDS01 n=1 Tax=Anthostomella pinea TaxID=933095 RepID=A0AAI8YAE0_9PEZI|nr:Uu.00g028470.m01.CDS01 [Anthostomella pinea]